MLTTDKILINVRPGFTRLAYIEKGEIITYTVLGRDYLAGSIYQGKVIKILPGMQACFVDIGLDREAFLHAKELNAFKEEHHIESQAPIQKTLKLAR